MDESPGIGAKLYCLWATLAIGLSIALAGFTAETVTRILVIVFLLGQIPLQSKLANVLPRLAPRTRFIALGIGLAAIVEGFHMISMPVFLSLRIDRGMSIAEGLMNYALDLLYTVPAYLVVFSVIWWFINRYRYPYWHYVITMGLGQALGDGGLLFFLSAPAMLVFLPYPMTNYHAINVMPFLAIREHLRDARSASAARYLAVPALIGTYFVCGAIIRIVGRAFGLDSS